VNRSLAPSRSCRFHWLTWIGWMAWSAAISWIVLRPLIASMATLALNSGLWVRRLLIVGAPFRGGTPPQRLTMGAVQKNQSTSEGALVHASRTAATASDHRNRADGGRIIVSDEKCPSVRAITCIWRSTPPCSSGSAAKQGRHPCSGSTRYVSSNIAVSTSGIQCCPSAASNSANATPA